MSLIIGENIQQAERILKIAYSIGSGSDPRIVLDRARVDRDAFEQFARHHKTLLFGARGYLPEIDPRVEPAIMTMLLHFFAVGAISQRLATKGEA